jgi:hypothetical protein
MVTVYDKEGKPHEKESCDARECVDQLGWSMEAPESKEEAPKATRKKADK